MNRLPGILLSILVIVTGVVIIGFNLQQTSVVSVKPQTPQPPFPYVVEKIAVETSSGITLGGTLTIPEGDDAFPAVILLSVAGPNDRDQAFAGHFGFQVLADHLTRRGVAVARFDDRGVGQSTGDYFNASWDDLADDALAIVDYLKADSRIDETQIGYAGMSQGAAVGALAVAKTDVAFLILLSAPGLTGVETLSLQLENTLSASGVTGERADRYRQYFRQYMEIVQSDPADPQTAENLLEFLDGPGKALIPPYRFLPPDNKGLVSILLGPWYQSNINFDPETTYGAVDIPVLAIGGGKDFVVPPGQHLLNIGRVLEGARADDVTTKVLPELNHLLQEAETGLPTEYASLENSFSTEALEIISGWVTSRTITERAVSTDAPAAE